MRRCLIALVLILALVLSACVSGESPPATALPADTPAGVLAPSADAASPTVPTSVPAGTSDAVTIGFASSEYSRALYEPLIAAFNKQNPGIRVQFIAIDALFSGQDSPGEQAARRILSAADTAVWTFQPGDPASAYLLDLAPLMNADASFDRGDFYPGVLDAFSANGATRFLPSTLSVALLSYNKDLWMASGAPLPDPNWSWPDLLDAAGRLAKKRGDAVDVYGLLDPSSGGMAMVSELSSTNPDLFAVPPEQLNLDTPAVQTALSRIAALVEAGAIALPSPQASDQELPQLIRDQHVAIWPADRRVRYLDPDKPDFTIGSVPYPQLPAPLFRNDASGYVISAGTQHPQESWRWLTFLSQQAIDEAGADMPPAASVPARRSIAEHTGYWSRIDPEMAAVIQAALARPVPATPHAANYDLALPLLGIALGSVVRDHKPVTEATRALQADLQTQATALLLTPQPTPDTRPIIVGTPAPTHVAGAGATAISFGVPGDAEAFRSAAQAFGQKRPDIAVEITSLGSNAGPGTLADAANATDCFISDGAPQADELAALLDLRPLLDADATLRGDDYPAALLAPFQSGGHLYRLPNSIDVRALAYNQAAFAAAGLAPPQAGWTPNDLVAAAQALTSGAGEARQYGFASTVPLEDLFFFIEQSGATLAQGSGADVRPNFTDPKIVQAARAYVDLLRNTSPQQRLSGYDGAGPQPDVAGLIGAGRVGMWFDFASALTQQPPSGQTVGIVPLPLGGAPLGQSQLDVSAFFISARSQHADACWAWISYLGGDVALAQGRFPARSSVAAASVQPGSPAAELYDAYRAALARPLVPASSSGLPRAGYFWFFRAIDRALQGKDLERELADAQALAEQFLVCLRGGAADACARQVDPTYQDSVATPVP